MAAYPQKGTRGTGRRKEAIARVRLVPGKGTILINGRSVDDFLSARKALHIPLQQPLAAAGVQEKYDVLANCVGGGVAGQSHAIRMGIARALASMSPEFAKLMRDEGFLTRDSRVKERKKYGLHKARKRPQFSKR